MKKLVLVLVFLCSAMNLRAMESDEQISPASLAALPSELLTEIAIDTSSLELDKNIAHIDWIKFFKRIQQIRRINTSFARTFLREPGEVHKFLSCRISPENPLFSTLVSLISKGIPTDFEKRVLTIASSGHDVPEALGLLSESFVQENWPIALFACTKIPKESVTIAGTNLIQVFQGSINAPFNQILQILLKKDPQHPMLLGLLDAIAKPHGQDLENLQDCMRFFNKAFLHNNRNISKTIVYFLEQYPFSADEKAYLSKICSATKEEADILAQARQNTKYGATARLLAFYAAIGVRSLSLAQVFENEVPREILEQSILLAVSASAPDIFDYFINRLNLMHNNDVLVASVGTAFEFEKIDMIDSILEKFQWPIERKTNSSLFLKACINRNYATVDALLKNPDTNSFPEIFIRISAIVMIKNNDRSLLEIVLKKTRHSFIEEVLIPLAMSLQNTEMVQFLKSHLAQVRTNQT